MAGPTELRPTLQMIAQSLVQLAESPEETAAVIWVYSETAPTFNLSLRVAAGEPTETAMNDLPRPNGMGWRAMSRRQRVLSYQERNLPLHPAQQQLGAKIAACYPLIVGSEIVGLLYIYRYHQTLFTETEFALFEHVAYLTALAIYHGQHVVIKSPDLTHRVAELEKLQLVSQRINSRSTLRETLQEILSISLEMVTAQYGSFELHDKKRHVLKLAAIAGYQHANTAQFDLPINEQSVVGQAAMRRQTLRIDDLNTAAWQNIYRPLPVDRPMRSELAVPLIGVAGGLEGIINLESPQPHAFTANHQRLLEMVARQAVIALQEIRLLDALQEIFKVLLTAQPLDLFQLILDCACDLINVPAGSVWLLEGETLVVQLSTAGYQTGDTLPLAGSLTEQAIRVQHPMSVDNLRLDPRFAHRQAILGRGWVSLIVVPLLLPHEALGSFSFFSSELRDFSNWDKRVLTCLANHAAVAIQYAKQLSQLRQAQERQAMAETFAAIGDVAANLLHQLNNKVGAIPAQIQAIAAKAPPTDPYLTKKLQEIEQSSRQALAIVRDSLAHLRPTERQAVDIATCLSQALQRATPPKSVTLSQHGLAELPRVMANEQQLEMVFYNLIDNALKAMPKRRAHLTLSGQATAHEVIITVTDNGRGIAPELQAQLFDFRPTPAQAQAGRLGFGLWWVKTFVERFGGRVYFASNVGQGSAFTVCLPSA